MEKFDLSTNVYNLDRLIQRDELKQAAVEDLEQALTDAVDTFQGLFPEQETQPSDLVEIIKLLRRSAKIMHKRQAVLDILCDSKEKRRLFEAISTQRLQTLVPKVEL